MGIMIYLLLLLNYIRIVQEVNELIVAGGEIIPRHSEILGISARNSFIGNQMI